MVHQMDEISAARVASLRTDRRRWSPGSHDSYLQGAVANILDLTYRGIVTPIAVWPDNVNLILLRSLVLL